MDEELNEEVVENEIVEDEYFQETYEDLEDLENNENVEDESKQEENQEENSEPAKTFTQEQLDEIVQKRLEREQKRFEKEQASNAQKVRDDYIKDQAYQNPFSGKQIETEAEYKQVLEQQRYYNELVENNGFTEEQAKQLAQNKLETDNLRKELEAFKNEKAQTSAIVDVMNWHEKMLEKGVLKESFDHNKIPQEVLNAEGSLKENYMEYILENLRLNVQQDTLKNLENKKQQSAGSTQDNSTSDQADLSIETINRMASDPEWVAKNYDAIEKSGYFKQY